MAAQAFPRGKEGVTPRTPTLEDESYNDYLEAVRNFTINELFPILGEQVTEAAQAAGLPNDGATGPFEAVAAVADPLPLTPTWKRLMRSQQQLSWNKLQDSYGKARDVYEKKLDDAERANPNRLHYDPNFEVPDYAKYPIHLQPGGYVGDSLAGYVFHHGTKVFYQGANDQDELHKLYASQVREPSDGKIGRILDIGCSIGQCTTALKEDHPEAEVWGLDVGLPLLRYAHARATDMNVDVNFIHGLAEELPFPDGHFDIVLSYILFHEVPERVFQPIINEVFRVLRPGGTFTVIDAPNATALPAANRVWQVFDAEFNCEPYAPAFVASDLVGMLDAAGFADIERFPTGTFLVGTHGTKPAS